MICDMDNRLIKLLVAAGAVMVALVLGVVGWVIINSRDIAPVDTSDLARRRSRCPIKRMRTFSSGRHSSPFSGPKTIAG